MGYLLHFVQNGSSTKHIKTHICTQQSQKSNTYKKYREILFQKVALGYLLHFVGVRGSPERDISSLRALGPGGGQISTVVHVSTRAAFGVFAEK